MEVMLSMSKIPSDMRDHKRFKYKEYILNHPELELNETNEHIFFSAFNVGYKASRDRMRGKINAVNTYDECLHCGCLALINRQTLMCMDCGQIKPKEC